MINACDWSAFEILIHVLCSQRELDAARELRKLRDCYCYLRNSRTG